MNAESAAPQDFGEQEPPRRGWSLPRLIFVLTLAAAAHFALIYLFGAKKEKDPSPRTATNAPQFHLTEGEAQLVGLTDPTLFARPHEAVDFVPADWRRPPTFTHPAIHWTEPPQFLSPAAENLGATFSAFMQTNRPMMQTLNIKPEPQIAQPNTVMESALPDHSALKIFGALAHRRLLNQINVPSIPCNDVLAPSRVQVLVDASGAVISAVALEPSELPAADQQALAVARALRFAPAEQPMIGEIIFIWHTVPKNAP
jgi:TonB family protein